MRTSFLLLAGMVLNASSIFAQVPDYAGCKESDYVTISQSELTIRFQGSSYEPACIKIKRGTKVTVPASEKHPLQAARDFDGIVNPLRIEGGDHVQNQTVAPEAVGFYGYYCTRHGDPDTGDGMGGMIWVVE